MIGVSQIYDYSIYCVNSSQYGLFYEIDFQYFIPRYTLTNNDGFDFCKLF